MTCECKRTFSAMRRLKNYNRSTMIGERLNGLALLHVHQEIVPDFEEVIDKFAAMVRADSSLGNSYCIYYIYI